MGGEEVSPLLGSLPLSSALPGPVFGGCTWQRGMHDRKHQSPGTEGLPAHVGKDGNTEAAQDETGIQHAAQRLGCAGGEGDTSL